MKISVIIPVLNGERWLCACLQSVLEQDIGHSFEVSIYNDASTDSTPSIIEKYYSLFQKSGIKCTYSHGVGAPGGVAFAKNEAVSQSCGQFLCFQDADDRMTSNRLRVQYDAAVERPLLSLFGSRFVREPKDSTVRYTNWANDLSEQQLYTQAYTSHGPTLIAPTWFCSRQLYDRVGGFKQNAPKGCPEDLDFFYRALSVGAELHRLDQVLVTYNFHQGCASFSVSEQSIWQMRLAQFEHDVLDKWSQFSVGGGRLAKRFVREVSDRKRDKIVAFCEVDEAMLKHGYYQPYDQIERRAGKAIPVVPYDKCVLPIVICVKQQLTQGKLEQNLEKFQWIEGKDFYHFG